MVTKEDINQKKSYEKTYEEKKAKAKEFYNGVSKGVYSRHTLAVLSTIWEYNPKIGEWSLLE